jgi:hypothetical protein
MRYTFTDGWGFNFFAGHLCKVGFFELVEASTCQATAGIDRLKNFHGWDVYSEFA